MKQDQKHFSFYLEVLRAFQLDYKTFFGKVGNKEPFENTLYKLIESEFKKGLKLQQAIIHIYGELHKRFIENRELFVRAS